MPAGKVARLTRTLGAWNAVAYLVKTHAVDRVFGRRLAPSLGTLRSRLAQHPVAFRYGTSDATVFWQVFVVEDYREVCMGAPRVIVDCGANVGYASTYFASRYPEARILSLEPDKSNYEMLARNVAAFGPRVTPINQAVWSAAGPLRIVSGAPGGRDEWGVRVRACQPGEAPDVSATTIDALMRRHHLSEIDILKIDIEGAELDLFSSDVSTWLPAVRTIIIELHGPRCREAFEKTVVAAGFAVHDRGHSVMLASRESSRRR